MTDRDQFIIMCRKPEGWTVPKWDSKSSGSWSGLRNDLKSISRSPTAATVVRGLTGAKTMTTRCRNLGLEAEYMPVSSISDIDKIVSRDIVIVYWRDDDMALAASRGDGELLSFGKTAMVQEAVLHAIGIETFERKLSPTHDAWVIGDPPIRLFETNLFD